MDLIPVAVTDYYSGALLKLAYVDDLCLNLSLRTGVAHYLDRSKNQIHVQGLTCGNVHLLQSVLTDCSVTSLCFSVLVLGSGRTCHTRRPSCFYRTIWRRNVPQRGLR
ncbi:MAG: phosphoribosyl-AMP cyclohydrolase [Candidatus Hodgkinia cicadicola]